MRLAHWVAIIGGLQQQIIKATVWTKGNVFVGDTGMHGTQRVVVIGALQQHAKVEWGVQYVGGRHTREQCVVM